MKKSYPLRSKYTDKPFEPERYIHIPIPEIAVEPSTSKQADELEELKFEESTDSEYFEEVTMSTQDDDTPMRFQNLMQSIPMYEGSQKQSVRDFFDSIENVANSELGPMNRKCVYHDAG